jgi:hypothetical protein
MFCCYLINVYISSYVFCKVFNVFIKKGTQGIVKMTLSNVQKSSKLTENVNVYYETAYSLQRKYSPNKKKKSYEEMWGGGSIRIFYNKL